MIATQKEKTFVGILAVFAAALIAFVAFLAGSPTGEKITGYDDCVAGGGMILESYPERCITEDGDSFTRPIQ